MFNVGSIDTDTFLTNVFIIFVEDVSGPPQIGVPDNKHILLVLNKPVQQHIGILDNYVFCVLPRGDLTNDYFNVRVFCLKHGLLYLQIDIGVHA